MYLFVHPFVIPYSSHISEEFVCSSGSTAIASVPNTTTKGLRGPSLVSNPKSFFQTNSPHLFPHLNSGPGFNVLREKGLGGYVKLMLFFHLQVFVFGCFPTDHCNTSRIYISVAIESKIKAENVWYF